MGADRGSFVRIVRAHYLCARIMRYSARMATERVTLTMDQAALSAARSAATDAGVSLSEWLSRAAWRRAIEQAATVSAEQDRHLPDEFADLDADRHDRIFGTDAAA